MVVQQGLVWILGYVQGEKMSDENTLIPTVPPGATIAPITRADFAQLASQRSLLREFVAKQLARAVDFGVIPGCEKPSLFKPGAEKLGIIFKLVPTQILTKETVDIQNNYAQYSYRCELRHRETGQLIATCEGTCGSQEKKYRERTVWEYSPPDGKKIPRKEVTPVGDLLNTLMKMAQKRAYVGAMIVATGASDFFTQDLDDMSDAQSIGATPEIRDVGSNIPNVTRVSSEPHQKHDHQKETYLAEALVDYDEREFAKRAGFKWDKEAKKWLKRVSADEVAGFAFKTQRLS